ERRLSADGKIPNAENALLRRLVRALGIERDPHLTSGDLGIYVGEAEKGAGIIALDEHHLPAIGPASAQIAEQRRIAPELGAQGEIRDDAAAPRRTQIEAAQ